MRLTRTRRMLSALVAVAALLFAQLAVSAFACPMTGGGDDNANLCQQHCAYGKVSFDSGKQPAASPGMVAAPLRIVALPSIDARAGSRPATPAAGPDPPFERFTVLRI